jgi:hypothetical protein
MIQSDTELKALKALSYILDLHPEGVPGSAKVFWDELVAYRLLSNGYIKFGPGRMIVTPKGKDHVIKHLGTIGNA